MKTVVITGSARGLGFEMAKNFRAYGFNVVLSDINEQNLANAKIELSKMEGAGEVASVVCNVCDLSQVENLWAQAFAQFGSVDVWINNAGVNQPPKHAWDLAEKEIDFLINVDLKGTINGSNVAMRGMANQGFGAIYNVEGFGSNDAYQENLVMYGTTKRAVTYFTTALAKEAKIAGHNVIVGKLSPGIMITDFLTSSNGQDGTSELPEKVKKVYNILGDYPDVIAKFLVKKMVKNTKNNAHIQWLTSGKAFCRFMGAGFNKRNFFK